jgi:WD40 repeat protein
MEISSCGTSTNRVQASMVSVMTSFISNFKLRDVKERRSKDHLRSVHALSVSHIVHHYCITGSADGDMRVWVRDSLYPCCFQAELQQDLRDLTRSLMRVHHPTSVRSVVFSPSTWQPLHAVVGLDNGSIYRYAIIHYFASFHTHTRKKMGSEDGSTWIARPAPSRTHGICHDSRLV